MKTLAAIFWLIATLGVSAARAAPDMLALQFASCAGRFSAEMEFQWLMSDPASDRTEQDRAGMIELTEAVAWPGDGALILNRRIEAKLAHQELLTRATFAADPGLRVWARRRADAELAQCRGLLLAPGA